jgi:(4-(4-[2-(gamma-L-glutamylamino)ethyl]phenoxymethyl)furan-2-yl)methanamine synthase
VVEVLGLDIGGANTKAVYIRTEGGALKALQTELVYFPFWKRDTEQVKAMLIKLRTAVAGAHRLDCVAVTLTAELSDAYRTKREGVNHILTCAAEAFSDARIRVVTVDAALVSVEEAKTEPLRVAAANWAATGWLVSGLLRDCVVVDVGSTSTSIIPITHGKVSASGKTDLDKLMNGELVYTGSLRTNVAATVQTVPFRGGMARVASELFAQSGDIHLVLNNITAEEYTSETADGKQKTRTAALARLARVVCSDTEMLTEAEILQLAKYVWSKQVEQIAEGLSQVYARLQPDAKQALPVVVTGLGKDFLAKNAAQKTWVCKVVDLAELLSDASLASPAVGAALMAATELEGRRITWTQ